MTKIHESEQRAVHRLVRSFAAKVAPALRDEGTIVLSADAGFNAVGLRPSLRELGIVENIQLSSASTRAASVESAQERDLKRYTIEGVADWFANGHRELICRCGLGTIGRTFDRNRDGKVVVRAEGRCANCGNVTITSGQWYLAANTPRVGQSQFRRIRLGEDDHIDWLFGNPLTFNDPLSKTYGKGRFGHQEGFFGHLVTRFGILREKGWYRRRAQAELDLVITFCVMHVVTMEQRRRSRLAQQPPLAAPSAVAAVAA